MNDIEPDDLAPELDPAADKVVYTSPDPVPAPKFIGSLLQGTVSIAALKFEAGSRNSASVKIVQERLMELGFMSAGADRPGWLSTGTHEALGKFCGCDQIAGCTKHKNTLIHDLFKGTNVVVAA